MFVSYHQFCFSLKRWISRQWIFWPCNRWTEGKRHHTRRYKEI